MDGYWRRWWSNVIFTFLLIKYNNLVQWIKSWNTWIVIKITLPMSLSAWARTKPSKQPKFSISFKIASINNHSLFHCMERIFLQTMTMQVIWKNWLRVTIDRLQKMRIKSFICIVFNSLFWRLSIFWSFGLIESLIWR